MTTRLLCVGSCADLISTIFRSLHAYYPAKFQIAPLIEITDFACFSPLRSCPIYPVNLAVAPMLAVGVGANLTGSLLPVRTFWVERSCAKGDT